MRAPQAPVPAEVAATDESEADEDETEEQPGLARSDQAAGGERRPRRRGRRGGRRRRGGPEDGPGRIDCRRTRADIGAGGGGRGGRFRRIFRSHRLAGDATRIHRATARAATRRNAVPRKPRGRRRSRDRAGGRKAAARRRSTVREKVSFLVNAQPDVAAPVSHTRPSRSCSPPQPSRLPQETRRHPAPPRRMVVAALRRRRIGNLNP